MTSTVLSRAASGAEPARAPLLEVQGLRRVYGELVAVKGISFSIGRGEVVGFLGPNGAGKSTTLRMIVGYLGPSAGRVRVGGFDVVEEPLRARQAIGYMPETAPLYPEMRVREYLAFRARLKNIRKAELGAEIERVAYKAGVFEVAHSIIGTLSRGYRQRVALADALIGNPPLLILDEPTAGLDPNQIHSVRTLIRELGEAHTVFLSTHILSEVESTCTRAIVIHRGAVVAEGSIAELRHPRGSARAVVTVYDVRQQALELLIALPSVLSVVPVATSLSLIPPSPERLSGVDRPSAVPYAAGAIVSFRITFQPDLDGPECLEELVARLVEARLRIREAKLEETSLEEVFRQLTGATEEEAEP